jgi:uncharacterized RDD family membrane protein YckC
MAKALGAARETAHDALDTSVEVETPEHIVFHHRVAGPARRFFAYLVDLIVCYTVVFAIGFAILLLTVGGAMVGGEIDSAAKLGIGLILVVLFCAQWVYFAAFEALTGRTPGKRFLGLQVLTVTGRPIGFREAALRNVARAADALPIGNVLGAIVMALTSRFQRLGDLIAGTMVVVYDPRRREVPAFRLFPPLRDDERATLPDHVTLDPEERGAIELFLRRRETLGMAREDELARMIAGPIAARFGFQIREPSRALAVLYDRAMSAGREEAPVSSRAHGAGKPPQPKGGAAWP